MKKLAINVADIVDSVDNIEATTTLDIRIIPLHEIEYHPQNNFRMTNIEKLAESIKRDGQLHNGVVRKFQNAENPIIKYQLLSGERRHRALTLNEADGMACKVIECDDLEAERILIVTNIETRELTEIEKAQAVGRLAQIIEEQRAFNDTYKGVKTRDIIAEQMTNDGNKINASTVGKYLAISKNLIKEFEPLVETGEISRELAYQYAQMTPEVQKMAFDSYEQLKLTAKTAKEFKIDTQNMSVEEVEHLIADMKENISNLTTEKNSLDQLNQDLKDSVEKSNKTIKTLENDLNTLKENVEARLKKEKESIEQEYSSKISTLQNELNEKLNAIELLNTEDENRKTELSNELRKQFEESYSKVIEAKENEFKNAIQKADEEKKNYEDEIASLRDSQSKNTFIEMNKTIEVVARQAHTILQSLTLELSKCTKLDGFELSEATMETLKSITKFNVQTLLPNDVE